MTITTTSLTPFYLAGEPRSGTAVKSIVAPFDGAVLGAVALAGRADAERAVSAAAAAMGRELPPFERAAILDRAAVLLSERRGQIAQLLCREVGKPITLARGEVDRAVSTLQFSASVARTWSSPGVAIDAAPSGVGKLAYTMAVPAGIVAAITPFNFPLNLVAHKLAPAIAAGCAVVLKPAPQAPLTALAFADVLFDAGLPRDYLSVLPGSAEDIGAVLTQDDRVAVITFTGSTRVGWLLREQAPRKKVLLELGNSAPAIVHADANIQKAAAKLTAGAFAFAGQSCVSVQRVYAHRSIVDELQAAVLDHTASIAVGDPADDQVVVGPVIDDAARDRLVSWIDQADAAGAQVLTGGGADGRVVQPTILSEIAEDQPLAQQEAFGPVFGITAYDDITDAFEKANGTRFALQASLFTANLRLAVDATRALRFGAVLINEAPTFRTDNMPYGGGEDSGNTKEGPASAVRELTEDRLVIVDHT